MISEPRARRRLRFELSLEQQARSSGTCRLYMIIYSYIVYYIDAYLRCEHMI